MNIEAEMAEAILPMGGVRVSEILGHSPNIENADFVFKQMKVIVELKSLEEDKLFDEKIIEKASSAYFEEFSNGRADKIVFGTVLTTTQGCSDEFTQKISDFYRVPVERQIKKANNQIHETAKALNFTEFMGVVVVANNNNTALDPSHCYQIIKKILEANFYQSIHVIIFMSGKLGAVLPHISNRIDYWIQCWNENTPLVQHEFLNSFRIAWQNHLKKLSNSDILFSESLTDLTVLANLESK